MALDNKLRILMISYACSPLRGGEHLLGWNWAVRLAQRGHLVTVLTAAHRIKESEGYEIPGVRLIGVDDRSFSFLRNTGLWGAQLYYQMWNRGAAATARRLTYMEKFDVLHQCTFHTFRTPCLPALWGDMPTVWGPVAGLESIPIAFLPSLKLDAISESLRYIGNWIRLRQPIVKRCLSRVDQIIVSNNDTRKELEKVVAREYIFIPANAVELEDLGQYSPPNKGSLDIVAVGALVPMRPYSIILRAIANIPVAQRAKLTLTFIGSGRTENELKAEVKKHGLNDIVRFLGSRPRSETLAHMRRAHLLIFPSFRDSGGSSVAEAMTMGLPVLGFAMAGPGAMLQAGGGFQMKSRTTTTLIDEIRSRVESLLEDPSILGTESLRGMDAAKRQYDWSMRMEKIETLYMTAIGKKGGLSR